MFKRPICWSKELCKKQRVKVVDVGQGWLDNNLVVEVNSLEIEMSKMNYLVVEEIFEEFDEDFDENSEANFAITEIGGDELESRFVIGEVISDSQVDDLVEMGVEVSIF